MEELIRWLFIIFLVFSFFRSIFKKKAPQGQNKPGPAPGTGESPPYGRTTAPPSPPERAPEEYKVRTTNNQTGYSRPEDDPRNYKYGQYVPPVQDQTVKTPAPYSTGMDEYDIQREIEKLFKKDTQQPTAEPSGRRTDQPTSIQRKRAESETTQDPYEKTQSPYETTHEEAKIDTSLRESDHYIKQSKLNTDLRTSDHSITPFKREKRVSTEEEDLAKKFAMNLKKKEDMAILFNKDLRSRLRHPETLKDYVVISEILGKPKALE